MNNPRDNISKALSHSKNSKKSAKIKPNLYKQQDID
jgi:hypothetical protein